MTSEATMVGLRKLNRTMATIGRRVAPSKMNAIAKRIGQKGLQQLVLATPVDLGQHRGAWTVGLNGRGGGGGGFDPGGGPTIARGFGVINGASPRDSIHMSNNAPAIRVLEDGLFSPPNPGPSSDPRKGRKGRVLVSGGYSVQAPDGMLGPAVKAMRAATAKEVRRIAAEPRRKHGGR